MPDDPQPDDDEAFDEIFDEDELYLDEQRHARIAKLPKWKCRFCNRPERFARDTQPTILRSYIKGLTFGISGFFGPYKCVCCGISCYKMPGKSE